MLVAHTKATFTSSLLSRQILKAPCLLLSLFTSLNLCSGKYMTPITDDVSRLSLLVGWQRNFLFLNSLSNITVILRSAVTCCKKNKRFFPMQKQNIPSDYEIPVSYIPKEVVSELDSKVHTLWFNMSNKICFIALTCFVSSRRLARAGWCWISTLWSKVCGSWPACLAPSPPTGSTSSSSSPCWRVCVSPSTTKSWWVSFPAKVRLLFPTRELHHWFTSAPLVVDWSPRKQPCKSSSVTTARGAWCRVSTLTTSRTSCTPPRKEHPASPASRRRALIYKTRRVRRLFEFMHFWWSPRKSKAA